MHLNLTNIRSSQLPWARTAGQQLHAAASGYRSIWRDKCEPALLALEVSDIVLATNTKMCWAPAAYSASGQPVRHSLSQYSQWRECRCGHIPLPGPATFEAVIMCSPVAGHRQEFGLCIPVSFTSAHPGTDSGNARLSKASV